MRVGNADFLFDGNAGIVADFLFEAGKRVKERAFATIRIADKRVDRLAG